MTFIRVNLNYRSLFLVCNLSAYVELIFFVIRLKWIGNCFSFNVGVSSTGESISHKTTTRADKEHALIIDVYVGLSSATQKLSLNRGVNVKVNQTVPSIIQFASKITLISHNTHI